MWILVLRHLVKKLSANTTFGWHCVWSTLPRPHYLVYSWLDLYVHACVDQMSADLMNFYQLTGTLCCRPNSPKSYSAVGSVSSSGSMRHHNWSEMRVKKRYFKKKPFFLHSKRCNVRINDAVTSCRRDAVTQWHRDVLILWRCAPWLSDVVTPWCRDAVPRRRPEFYVSTCR